MLFNLDFNMALADAFVILNETSIFEDVWSDNDIYADMLDNGMASFLITAAVHRFCGKIEGFSFDSIRQMNYQKDEARLLKIAECDHEQKFALDTLTECMVDSIAKHKGMSLTEFVDTHSSFKNCLNPSDCEYIDFAIFANMDYLRSDKFKIFFNNFGVK